MRKEKIEKIMDFLRHNLYLITLLTWYILENLQISNIHIYIFGYPLSTWDSRVFDWGFLVILIFIIFFLKKYSTKEKVIIGIITLFFAISVYISSYRPLLSVWLFIVACKDEDLDRILKWAYGMLLALVIVVVVLCLLGIVQDTTPPRDNGIIRHSLGFGHPNTLGIMVTQLALYRLYIHRKNITLWDVLLTIADIVFVYVVPNSQTSYVSMTFALILLMLLRITEKHPKLNQVYLWALVIFCLFCNIFCLEISLTNSLESGALAKINYLGTFRARASLAHSVYQKFGVHIFGTALPAFETTVEIDGAEFHMPVIDSSYMNLLLHCGVIAYLIYSFLYLGTAKWSKKKNAVLLVMYAVFAAHGIMEKSTTELRHNLFLLAISFFLFSENFMFESHCKNEKLRDSSKSSVSLSFDKPEQTAGEMSG